MTMSRSSPHHNSPPEGSRAYRNRRRARCEPSMPTSLQCCSPSPLSSPAFCYDSAAFRMGDLLFSREPACVLAGLLFTLKMEPCVSCGICKYICNGSLKGSKPGRAPGDTTRPQLVQMSSLWHGLCSNGAVCSHSAHVIGSVSVGRPGRISRSVCWRKTAGCFSAGSARSISMAESSGLQDTLDASGDGIGK